MPCTTRKTLAAIGGSLALAGCGSGPSSLVEKSPSARCADAMKAAMPKVTIEVTAMKGAADDTHDLNTMRATAEGKAQDGKAGPLAMECVFRDGVLVSIRWLAPQEAAR